MDASKRAFKGILSTYCRNTIGVVWPSVGMNPFRCVLNNTSILLSSGATVTWTHHGIISGNKKGGCKKFGFDSYISINIFMEYWKAPFTTSDSVYCS